MVLRTILLDSSNLGNQMLHIAKIIVTVIIGAFDA